MTSDARMEALAKAQLFSQVSRQSLEPLADRAIERRLKQGEILFTRGEAAKGMYVIVSGALRAFRESEEGREQTIHVEYPGATLAEVPVFDDGPCPSTTMAEEDSVVLFLEKSEVQKFLRENPEAALAALRMLGLRLRKVTSLVEQLSLQDVTRRLANMLLTEATKNGNELVDGISFSLAEPQQRIAARLGSVREVISRHLGRLAEEGLIEVRGHRITILNIAGLRAK